MTYDDGKPISDFYDPPSLAHADISPLGGRQYVYFSTNKKGDENNKWEGTVHITAEKALRVEADGALVYGHENFIMTFRKKPRKSYGDFYRGL